jgi:hypothetical protein
MKITVQSRDLDRLRRSFATFSDRRFSAAIATALTRTGQEVKAAEVSAIREVFDRPTPFTQRALQLTPATAARLQCQVWLKRGSREEHYLLPQIEGGGRPMKRFEERLRMTGKMRADERAVPGQAARLDAYGNMSRGQIVQILSQLRTAVVQGDFSNASNSKRSRAKRANVQYFLSEGPGTRVYRFRNGRPAHFTQHLPRGVWERRLFSTGSAVRPVLLFVRGVSYRKRLDFFGIADRVIAQRLPDQLQRSLAEQLDRLARKTGGAA